jgi:AbrB family looped-hinge helix DNA binding protein
MCAFVVSEAFKIIGAFTNSINGESLLDGNLILKWYLLSQVEIKEIDDQGRIVIPKHWRKGKLRTRKVLMTLRNDDSIEIVPYNTMDLTKYFDSVEVDVKSPLSDWHSLKKELSGKRKTTTKK